jgi:ribosomal protein S1
MTNMQNNNNADSITMEQLMAQYSSPVMPARGTLIQGTVFRIDNKLGAWIDFGGKTDALVPADELADAGLTEGQTSTFFVLSAGDEEGYTGGRGQWTGPVFSVSRARAWNSMQENLEQKTTVTVKVTRVARNGTGGIAGLNVALDGSALSGFVPYSMLAAGGRTVDTLVGSELQVKVAQVDPDKRKLIFNHREFVAEQAAETQRKRDELFANLQVGEVRDGKVVRIVEYGCFVDVGEGLHGLVHRSELSNDSKVPVTRLVKVGDTFPVKVLRAETKEGKRQLALSVKQLRAASFFGQVKLGDVLEGSVSRVTAFGCFVELSAELGVDGLIHKSQYSSAVRNGRKTLNSGEAVRVKVIELDTEKGRIGLSLKDVAQPTSASETDTADA